MLKIGKIVSTHGIKGEIKIKSDFERKDEVFIPGFIIYFNDQETAHIIKSHRIHKNYNMITFDDYKNINEILPFIKNDVYIKKSDIIKNENDYLKSDLIGLDIFYLDKNCGKVCEYVYNNGNDLLMIKNALIDYIPYNDNFIEKVDLKAKKIIVKNIEGLMK